VRIDNTQQPVLPRSPSSPLIPFPPPANVARWMMTAVTCLPDPAASAGGRGAPADAAQARSPAPAASASFPATQNASCRPATAVVRPPPPCCRRRRRRRHRQRQQLGSCCRRVGGRCRPARKMAETPSRCCLRRRRSARGPAMAASTTTARPAGTRWRRTQVCAAWVFVVVQELSKMSRAVLRSAGHPAQRHGLPHVPLPHSRAAGVAARRDVAGALRRLALAPSGRRVQRRSIHVRATLTAVDIADN
jgi:hypothetical protein